MTRRDTGAVYAHCDECEWTWRDPDGLMDVEQGTFGLYIDSRDATLSEITESTWGRYDLQVSDE